MSAFRLLREDCQTKKRTMNRNKLFASSIIAVSVIVMASCAGIHPNEKIIAGKWKPVKVEKIVDSLAIRPAAGMTGGREKDPRGGRVESGGGGERRMANLDRLVQTEMRTTMEIYPDHTAIKNFPGKPMKATWKMSGKGSRIVARNLETKQKFTIDILALNKEMIEVIEHTPAGDIRITYERQQ